MSDLGDGPSDKSPLSDIPSLEAWAGGAPAIRRMFERFYERIRDDEILAPVFASMDLRHAQHVADFVAEVFGGPKAYTSAGGSHAGMIARHLGKALTHDQRRAWISLLLDTADEVGLPADPEFRASFVGYLEWGTRLAVMNSQDGVNAPEADMPMPAWSWSSPGHPFRP